MNHEHSTRDAYWQQDQDARFALYRDGQERAAVDLSRQAVTVHYEDGFTADLTVPDYVCAFGEAEKCLGLPRVDDVRGADGSPDPDARKGSELEADLARETRTPDQWARAYAARAYNTLAFSGAERGLSDAETQAGLHLAQAVTAMDSHDPKVAGDIRAHLEEASALLASGAEDQRYDSPSLACDKALAVIEYEDAQQAMVEGPEEEALRRGDLVSERERSDGTGGDWLFQPSRALGGSERESDRDDGSREL